MRRSIPLAIGLSLCLSILAVSLAVADTPLTNIRMSNSPDGPEMTQFPSMTSIVYVIFDFDYIDLEGEAIRIIVYNNSGTILFDRTETYTGAGTESIAISPIEGVFPDGRYVTNLYRGGLLGKSIFWEVTEAVGVATPTPRATATPTDTPTAIPTDTPAAIPEVTAAMPPTEAPYPMLEATATPTAGAAIAPPEAMETLPPTATTAPIAPTATSTPTPAMATPVPVTPTATAVSPMPLTATATPRPIPAPSPALGLSRLSANAFLYVVIGFTALLALLALGVWRK